MNKDELMKLFDKLKKDKKALIVIMLGLVGMLLILLSDSEADNNETDCRNYEINSILNEHDLAIEVENLIETIEGAGKCKVMITYKSFNETEYAIDKDEKMNNQGETDFSGEYVILDTGEKEEGMKIKSFAPEIKGIAVVCQGGNEPIVKGQIITSLSALFDISSNNISVAAMAN